VAVFRASDYPRRLVLPPTAAILRHQKFPFEWRQLNDSTKGRIRRFASLPCEEASRRSGSEWQQRSGLTRWRYARRAVERPGATSGTRPPAGAGGGAPSGASSGFSVGGQATAIVSLFSPVEATIVQPSELPDYAPPFSIGTARQDFEGNHLDSHDLRRETAGRSTT